jgi:hypothetical protein
VFKLNIYKIFIGKLLSDKFPSHNGLKQGYDLSPLLCNSALEYAIRISKKMKSVLVIQCDTTATDLC